jgi:hypothetical protein
VLQRRLSYSTTWNARRVDIAEPHFFVPNVSFAFKHSKLSANRGVVGLAWNLFQYFADSRPSKPVQNVHDLPFAASKRGVNGMSHVLFTSQSCYVYSRMKGSCQKIISIRERKEKVQAPAGWVRGTT